MPQHLVERVPGLGSGAATVLVVTSAVQQWPLCLVVSRVNPYPAYRRPSAQASAGGVAGGNVKSTGLDVREASSSPGFAAPP